MMIFEIKQETVLTKVDSALDAYQDFTRNIENHLNTMRNVVDEDTAVGLAKSIIYNRQMMQLYLERAAAMLELLGLFDPENDGMEYMTLRDKADALNEAARLSNQGEVERHV